MSGNDWKQGLSTEVVAVLEQSVTEARASLGDNLASIVLFGSAAEGRMRATSDVNVIFVLKKLDLESIKQWRSQLQFSAAAIDLQPMLLLQAEIREAAEDFAVKFSDIAVRRRVMYGPDPFDNLVIPRDALIRRVRQVLLNLTIRMRQDLLLRHEAGQTQAITDAVGPLRASAMVLLQLAGQSASSPREALETLSKELPTPVQATIAHMRELREQGTAADPQAMTTLFALTQLADSLLERAQRL